MKNPIDEILEAIFGSPNTVSNTANNGRSCDCAVPPKNERKANTPLDIPLHTDYVKSVHVDEVEKVVVVVFWNGSKEIIKCGEHDEFDVSVGVALGIARHLFGSHAKFYKQVVAKKTKYTKRLSDEPLNEYAAYCDWCKKNKKRLASETTFKKNKNKYLAKMKGEN